MNEFSTVLEARVAVEDPNEYDPTGFVDRVCSSERH